MKNISLLVPAVISILCFMVFLRCGSGEQHSDKIKKDIIKIQTEIEELRGLKFKHAVKIEHQSLEDFGKYLDRMLEQQIPERLVTNYGKIVKKLGLYRGPEIDDFRAMAKMVMQSQAAAYYDPGTETFFVVMTDLSEPMLNTVYSHELYHGLQDQHYDLEEFVLSQAPNKLNDDELLARQAVVEGEATYIMTLWNMKNLLGAIPDPSILQAAISMQSQLDVATMLEMLKGGTMPQLQQGGMGAAIKAMDNIPPFLLEMLIGAYLKGMGFIFEIQKQGWDEVENLYSKPPVSSEQILHPEKWFSNELPRKFTWPSFNYEKLLADWALLETNTIGELQWRIIFAEHQMPDIGKSAAAGWNGDTFAVLEHQVNKELLLLIFSSWDSVSEAKEFYLAYQLLLKMKYPEEKENVKVEIIDTNVLIIEGGNDDMLNNLHSLLQKIKITE